MSHRGDLSTLFLFIVDAKIKEICQKTNLSHSLFNIIIVQGKAPLGATRALASPNGLQDGACGGFVDSGKIVIVAGGPAQ